MTKNNFKLGDRRNLGNTCLAVSFLCDVRLGLSHSFTSFTDVYFCFQLEGSTVVPGCGLSVESLIITSGCSESKAN